MDRFRLVQRAANGRPLVVMDLLEAQEKNILWLRGTMRLGGRTPQVTYPASTRARDVARGRGRVDTGTTMTATWRVRGVTPEACIARVDRFLAAVDSGRERLLEWRPEGARASSFMRIIGPGSYNPLYEWIQWVGASDGPGMNIEVTWPIDPTIEGAPWDVNEDFIKPNAKPEGLINHLPNPGNESGIAGYWTFYANVITAAVSDELSVVRSGSRSVRVTATSAGSGQMGLVTTAPVIECEPGDTVRTAGYSRAQVTPRAVQSVIGWYTLNGVFITSTFGATVTNTTTGWTRTPTLEAVAPAEAYRASVYVVINAPANGENHYVDDVVATVNQDMPADAVDGDDDGFVWEGQPHKSRTLEAWESDLAEWTVDVGTSLAIVRPGEMSFAGLGAGAAEWRARHTGRNTGPRVNDEVEVVYQASPPATARVTATLSASDDGKTYLQAGVDSGGALRIQVVTSAGTINQGTGIAVTVIQGVTYTLRFSREGLALTAVLFDRDGVTVLGTATYTLTAAQALSFRRGGDAGVRVEGTTTSIARINAWRRRPNTWRVPTTLTLPDEFTIPDLPGSQGGPGHHADVYLQPTTQTSQWSFGLLAWTRKCGVENLVWNGDFEKDAAGWAAGGAGPDGGTTVAGVATGASIVRSPTNATKYGIGVGIVTGDGSVASQAASFRVYDRFKRGQLYTLLIALRNRSAALGAPGSLAIAAVAGGSLTLGAWYYKISALSAAGESLPSPTELAINSAAGSTNRLTWTSVPGATGYRIYRSNTGAGNEDESFDVGAVTTFDDTGALTWTARTPLTTATATAAIPSGTVALGFDSADRSQLTLTPTTTQTVYVVEWTPTTDHDFANIAVVGNAAAGTAVQTDIDEVVLFEGSAPPADADQAVGRGALRPFGKIPARADYRTTRTGAWASTAATDRVVLTPAGSGGTALLEWLVDPFLLESPTDERDPVVEVYLRAQVPTGTGFIVGLRGSVSAAPVDVAGARQYASPFFAGGRSLTPITGGGSFRTYRMGQLQLERDPRSRGRIAIRLALSWTSAGGTTPTFEPQYLFLAPVDGVASSPTGKAQDSTYPVAVPAQGAGQEANVRVITSDLTGLLLGARSWRGTVDSSFGGEPIEFAPGADVLLAPWLNAGVPDNTIAATPVDAEPLGAMIHAAVTPQHTLMVPGR